MRVALLGIAGSSGSGKSELAHRLSHLLGGPVVSLDSYYRDLNHLSVEERALVNYDEPESLDEALIFDHFGRLAAGADVAVPQYDFCQHARRPEAEVVNVSTGVVIIEGLFTLYWSELRDLLHTRVYVELEDEICFERRMGRDVRERGRTPESVQWQYDEVVRPMAERYIWPTKRHADVIVRGDAVLEESAAAVVAYFRGH